MPGHLGLRLLHGDARLQPSDHRQPERAARVARVLVRRQRLPQLRLSGTCSVAGMTPMISCGRPFRVIVLPSTSAAPPNLALPQSVREQHDPVVARRFVRLGEEPADQRPHAHDVEEVRRRLRALQAFRLVGARQVERGVGETGHDGKRRVLVPPVPVVRTGRDVFLDPLPPVVDPDHRDAIRLRIGQRAQQHAVEDAEHGGVDADAEGEGQHRDGRERRCAAGGHEARAGCHGRRLTKSWRTRRTNGSIGWSPVPVTDRPPGQRHVQPRSEGRAILTSIG